MNDLPSFPEAVFGTQHLRLLPGSPKISAKCELLENNNGKLGHLLRRSAIITVTTSDVNDALTLLSDFAPGTDVFSSDRCKTLSFPGKKTLTFSSAWLLPEMELIPGGAPRVTITFRAETVSGSLYTCA